MDKDNLKDRKIANDKKLFQCYLPTTPDRELLVWEKWIKIRKEEATKLGNIIRRPPIDLAMNLLRNERERIEWKTALVNAQIAIKPKCGYSLHEQAQRLKQESDLDNVYEVQRTRAELGRPRVIEHVGIPTFIQKTELGMGGVPQRKECTISNTEYVKYRKKREEDLAEKLCKIDPYRPSTSNLIIRGFRPKTPPPKMPRMPSITLDAPNTPPREYIESVYAVKINKSVWYKDIPGQTLDHLEKIIKEPGHEDCSSWTYYFNVPSKKVGRGILYLQNLGTVTLRYYWKKIRKQVPNIPYDTEQVFFFDKNEDLLSPGQSKEINFSFAASYPGIFQEFWELIFTNVCFFATVNEKILISLYADATENVEKMKDKIQVLKNEIQNEALKIMANDIMFVVLDKVFAVVPQTYPYKKYFLEAQIFVMKNPVCFYHQTEVGKMAEVFNKELAAPGETWDLSIATWRNRMMLKPYDDRMRLFDILKVSHSDLLKPWYEGDSLRKEKHDAVNNLWMQLANKMDADFARLCELYERPELDIETLDSQTQQELYNIFYLHVHEHVIETIEQCAGILSSLDSNRWIEFDFCRN